MKNQPFPVKRGKISTECSNCAKEEPHDHFWRCLSVLEQRDGLYYCVVDIFKCGNCGQEHNRLWFASNDLKAAERAALK